MASVEGRLNEHRASKVSQQKEDGVGGGEREFEEKSANKRL